VTLGDISARGGPWWKRPNAICRSAFSTEEGQQARLATIRAMLATCCVVVEPLHGSACATITAKRNAMAAAVITQLMVLACFLPARLRTLAYPVFML